MKILMITERFPFPPNDGVRLKIYHMLKGLSRRHEIVLLSFTESLDVNPGEIQSYCERIELIPRVTRSFPVFKSAINLFEDRPFSLKMFDSDLMRKKIHDILRNDHIDLVHLDMPNTAQFYDIVSHKPTFFAPHDSVTLNLRRRVKLEKNVVTRLYLAVQLKKWENYEKNIYGRFDKCFVVSDVDKEVLLSLNPRIDVAVAPNGVDTEFFRPVHMKEEFPSLVFHGSIESFQSHDAVLFFYDKIYGRIKDEFPSVKLYIVGKEPPQSVRELSKDKSVIVTGFVDDVRPYIDKSTLYICPIRSGSGIKNRLLEAMAMQKPIVALSKSCEAIEVSHMKDIYLAKNPDEFTDGIIRLFKDNKLREILAVNARELVKKKYSWEGTINVIEKAYNEAIVRKVR